MTTKKTKTPKKSPSRPKPPNPRDLANLQRGMLLGTHLAIVEADHPELDSKGVQKLAYEQIAKLAVYDSTSHPELGPFTLCGECAYTRLGDPQRLRLVLIPAADPDAKPDTSCEWCGGKEEVPQ